MKKSIDQSGLLRHSVFLFLTTQVANVSNLLYQAVTGRSLTTEEYGVLAAMMNLLLITATPMEALRTAMAHFVARTMKAVLRPQMRATRRSFFSGERPSPA